MTDTLNQQGYRKTSSRWLTGDRDSNRLAIGDTRTVHIDPAVTQNPMNCILIARMRRLTPIDLFTKTTRVHRVTPIDLFSRERASRGQFDTDGSNDRDGDQAFSPIFHAFKPSFSAFSRDEGDVEQIDRGVSTLARLVLELEERRIDREDNNSSNEIFGLGVVTA